MLLMLKYLMDMMRKLIYNTLIMSFTHMAKATTLKNSNNSTSSINSGSDKSDEMATHVFQHLDFIHLDNNRQQSLSALFPTQINLKPELEFKSYLLFLNTTKVAKLGFQQGI